jgi:hypothetical protein
MKELSGIRAAATLVGLLCASAAGSLPATDRIKF